MEKSELLFELKQLLDDGFIDHNEYELLKKKIVFGLNKEKRTTTISDNTTQQISNNKKNTNSNNRRIAIFIISLLFVIGGAYIVLYSGIFEKEKTQTEAKDDVDYQELEEEKNNHDDLQEEEEENNFIDDNKLPIEFVGHWTENPEDCASFVDLGISEEPNGKQRLYGLEWGAEIIKVETMVHGFFKVTYKGTSPSQDPDSPDDTIFEDFYILKVEGDKIFFKDGTFLNKCL